MKKIFFAIIAVLMLTACTKEEDYGDGHVAYLVNNDTDKIVKVWRDATRISYSEIGKQVCYGITLWNVDDIDADTLWFTDTLDVYGYSGEETFDVGAWGRFDNLLVLGEATFHINKSTFGWDANGKDWLYLRTDAHTLYIGLNR